MSTPSKPVWAYTYRIVPPQDLSRLRRIKGVLAEEKHAAREDAATWEGRLVADERVTHILVLSDSPELDRAANRRLESELRALDAGFSVTIPMAVHPNGDPIDDSIDDPKDAPHKD